MRFAALLAAFVLAYGGLTAVGVSYGLIGLDDGITRTISAAGAFTVGWLFRGSE